MKKDPMYKTPHDQNQDHDNTSGALAPASTCASITVRFVEDIQTGRCWFEEKLTNGQWVMIPQTKMACEGNARHALSEVIEQRRQQRLMIFRSVGAEEVIPIV